jgi:hypothetical protein
MNRELTKTSVEAVPWQPLFEMEPYPSDRMFAHSDAAIFDGVNFTELWTYAELRFSPV